MHAAEFSAEQAKKQEPSSLPISLKDKDLRG